MSHASTPEHPERESMEFDVVIVGAGPAGLAAACRLAQLARAQNRETSICVLEKGPEVGAHILSGAVMDMRGLEELFPDWESRGAPVTTRVTEDQVHLLRNEHESTRIPQALVPASLHNQGHALVSLGNLCRWLAGRAEELGVEIFPGFAASDILYGAQGQVVGVATGDMGIAADGHHKDSYTPGMLLLARHTLFAEGCRGHLGKQLITRFDLDEDADPQHYGLGLKELWEIDPALHQPGLVLHGSGWPLQEGTNGGFFLYHQENCQVAVGLILDLDYRNPWIDPYLEFQRLKHHPLLARYLAGGTRVAYGARALAKGGFNALPRMHFPGGMLIGCDAGTLNAARLKGIHTALKSGMLAAEEVHEALVSGVADGQDLHGFDERLRASWLYEELQGSRNFAPALHRLGVLGGGAFNFLEQRLLGGRFPITLHDRTPDHERLRPAHASATIRYPRPDGRLSFDRPSSVFLSNTNHEEDQPCHLHLADPALPLRHNLPEFAEPAQRYCPAGVYEILDEAERERLQINAQNCLHCKTCDIKDPAQNITWVAPEGGGGPGYPNM